MIGIFEFLFHDKDPEPFSLRLAMVLVSIFAMIFVYPFYLLYNKYKLYKWKQKVKWLI